MTLSKKKIRNEPTNQIVIIHDVAFQFPYNDSIAYKKTTRRGPQKSAEAR
jgi:hypothetical protein